MQCHLPAEARILPKAAEEGAAFQANMLSKTWDTYLDLTLDHPQASQEVTKT